MIGSLLTRALVLVFGYAYPAYECYKIVELNKPEIEQLRFWCQYWILVAALTVFERVGDTFISWYKLPMYSEAKLAFFIYLWYPKTKGTSYVYDTFFRPYVSKHEVEIDRNLLELRTRAGDIVVLYWQKAASYGQTRFFEILQYVASQSPSQSSRPRPVQQRQQQQPHQARQTPLVGAPGRQTAVLHPQQPAHAPPSPTKSQLQEPTKVGAPQPSTTPAAQPQASSGPATAPPGPETTGGMVPSEGDAMQVEVAPSTANENSNPPTPQETAMEEAIRMTRGRLRKRAAAASGAGAGPSSR